MTSQLIRRRRTQAAIAELMETVAEALYEAAEDKPGGVTATEIASRAFIPEDDWHEVQFTQYVLRQLAQTGFAENLSAGEPGQGHWRPKPQD